jgi:hypothetical protein
MGGECTENHKQNNNIDNTQKRNNPKKENKKNCYTYTNPNMKWEQYNNNTKPKQWLKLS